MALPTTFRPHKLSSGDKKAVEHLCMFRRSQDECNALSTRAVVSGRSCAYDRRPNGKVGSVDHVELDPIAVIKSHDIES